MGTNLLWSIIARVESNKQTDLCLWGGMLAGRSVCVCVSISCNALLMKRYKFCTGWTNVKPPGPGLLAGWLVIRHIIKSSFDINTVLHLLKFLCQSPTSPLHTHTPTPTRTHSHVVMGPATQPVNPPSPGYFPMLFMALSPLSDNKRRPRDANLEPAVCLTWLGIRGPSPATIKRNLSLNKKVTPYLLRLTMMKGNEDKGSSCRYQYKYYWKVN